MPQQPINLGKKFVAGNDIETTMRRNHHLFSSGHAHLENEFALSGIFKHNIPQVFQNLLGRSSTFQSEQDGLY